MNNNFRGYPGQDPRAIGGNAVDPRPTGGKGYQPFGVQPSSNPLLQAAPLAPQNYQENPNYMLNGGSSYPNLTNPVSGPQYQNPNAYPAPSHTQISTSPNMAQNGFPGGMIRPGQMNPQGMPINTQGGMPTNPITSLPQRNPISSLPQSNIVGGMIRTQPGLQTNPPGIGVQGVPQNLQGGMPMNLRGAMPINNQGSMQVNPNGANAGVLSNAGMPMNSGVQLNPSMPNAGLQVMQMYPNLMNPMNSGPPNNSGMQMSPNLMNPMNSGGPMSLGMQMNPNLMNPMNSGLPNNPGMQMSPNLMNPMNSGGPMGLGMQMSPNSMNPMNSGGPMGLGMHMNPNLMNPMNSGGQMNPGLQMNPGGQNNPSMLMNNMPMIPGTGTNNMLTNPGMLNPQSTPNNQFGNFPQSIPSMNAPNQFRMNNQMSFPMNSLGMQNSSNGLPPGFPGSTAPQSGNQFDRVDDRSSANNFNNSAVSANNRAGNEWNNRSNDSGINHVWSWDAGDYGPSGNKGRVVKKQYDREISDKIERAFLKKEIPRFTVSTGSSEMRFKIDVENMMQINEQTSNRRPVFRDPI